MRDKRAAKSSAREIAGKNDRCGFANRLKPVAGWSADARARGIIPETHRASVPEKTEGVGKLVSSCTPHNVGKQPHVGDTA